jgi:hypothetical protein
MIREKSFLSNGTTLSLGCDIDRKSSTSLPLRVQIRDVEARNWDVCFTPANGHPQPGRSGPKSAITGSEIIHSIISSARATRVGGTGSANALAVLRLMTSSNLVGSSTGRSAGLEPLRIRSTK